jgi:hypothetical protein
MSRKNQAKAMEIKDSTPTVEDDLDIKLKDAGGGLTDPQQVAQQLDRLRDEMEGIKTTVSQLPKDSPVPAQVTALETSIKAIEGTLGDIEKADWGGLIKTMRTEIDALSSQLQGAGTAEEPDVKGFAESLFDSEDLKAMMRDDPRLGRHIGELTGLNTGKRIVVPSVTWGDELKTVTTTDVGAVSPPVYRPGIVSDPELPRMLVRRIPRIVADGARDWNVPRETDDGIASYITTEASAAVTGGTTPVSSIPVKSVAGFTVGSVARIVTTGGTYEEVVTGIDVASSELDFDIAEIDFDIAEDDKITSTFFGATGELQTKPDSGLEIELVPWAFRTMALILPMSQQVINTVAGIESWGQNKLRVRTERNYSRHLLYGDAATYADQLQGFSTYTGAQTFVWSTDGVASDNRADAIVRASNLIRWPGPQTVVLSRGDITNLNLEKTTTEAYVHSTLFGRLPLQNIGGTWFLGPWELMEDDAVTPGDFFLVNFAYASEMVDQNRTSMTAGMINDDFVKNILRWRYEEVVLHAILSTAAYVVGEWDSAPT